jgi:acetolactate synthase-1/2/3 large subunit|uniref:Acetolactate synthase n=1 Tax=Coscinodiscus wailesii TaxID=671091 RepID=A0A8A6KQD2_9STRA|nr:acetohydroxyacid synthetase large subunit [Coscinodiscus wailesii]QTI82869.1 acetohydroxyacid synthetase large subunit [Coscinodiscus wailesii]
MSKTKIRNAKTGAFALLDTLVRNSTKHIFGYPGGAILPIYDELYFWEKQDLIKHILTRHEQGAIHAADSYARVTGQIGVCFATSGPGATNLVTGIANAQMDSIPIIIITGQVNSNFIGTDAFQETDIFGITLPIVKHSYKIINPKDICKVISEAFYIAQNGRPGPIVIDIPKDIGAQEIFRYRPVQQKEILKLQGYRFHYKINRQSIIDALSLIRKAERPILYVGGGTIISNTYKELFELAKIFLIPVTTTLMGKGVFDERDILSIGMLGMHGSAYANFAVSECDLLIAVGARFDDRVTGKLDSFACLAKIIHIDIDPAEIGKNKIVDISLIGDVKRIFQEILITHKWDWENYTLPAKRIIWLECISQWRKTYPLIIPKLSDKLSPQQVISILGKQYPTAIFTTDVGQHQMWSAQFIKCGPRRWSTSAGLGTMGYGLPAAIGAQIAFPNEYVVCISGDSSFQMCLQELGTIGQNKLPIRIIIINNYWQGMVRQWQESFYDNRYSHSNMSHGQPNFLTLANSYGIESTCIENEKELINSLTKYKDYSAPVLFNCLVVENENCYPMVSPGATNAAMTGIKYNQDEIELLKRHSDENDDIDSFLSNVKNE